MVQGRVLGGHQQGKGILMNLQCPPIPLDPRHALEVESYVALINARLSGADALIRGTVGRRLLKDLIEHGVADLSFTGQFDGNNNANQKRHLTLAGIRIATNAEGDLTLLRCWQSAAVNRLPRR